MRRGRTELALFVLSEAAGLAYELSWSRQVGLCVGQTAEAAALVLTAFFLGQAAGSAAGAAVARRHPALVFYGVAELLAAGWAALVPAVLDATRDAGRTGDGDVQRVLCVLILFPAALLIGTTFPLMARHLDPEALGRSGRVNTAYALNTLGATLGVGAVMTLLPRLGVRTVGYSAAGISAACGLAALLIAWVRSCGALVTPVAGRRRRTDRLKCAPWLAVAAVSGFGTLAAEVLYVRMFSLVFHNSTYTFGAVLAVFLAGLALAAFGVAAIGRRVEPRKIAAAATSLGAIAVPCSAVAFARLTGLNYFVAGDGFPAYLAAAIGLVAGVVLPPVLLLGAVLPAGFVTTGGSGNAGRLAAANTLAAAVGAFAAGAMTNAVGLWGAFALVGLLFGVTGAALLVVERSKVAAVALSAAVTASALGVTANPVQPSEATARGDRLVRRWESAYGWIDVARSLDGAYSVRQNLHYRHGSTGRDAVRERRQGRLPLLLHPAPTDVAFLGLGTGSTAAAVEDPRVARAVVVELIPEVVEAARSLAGSNPAVNAPKVEVRVDDARHYLLRTDRRFDVIVSDLFVPWESGTGYLYTVEHFAAARRRLKPGGVYCQWLALYQLGGREFELVADSFASVFPRATLWWGQFDPRYPIVALVGTDVDVDLDPARLGPRFWSAGDATEPRDPLLGTPDDLPNLFIGRWAERPSRPKNTDEHPRVEFDAPVSHRAGALLQGATLRAYFDQVLAVLPSDGVQLPAESTGRDGTGRLALQRLVLFGAAEE